MLIVGRSWKQLSNLGKWGGESTDSIHNYNKASIIKSFILIMLPAFLWVLQTNSPRVALPTHPSRPSGNSCAEQGAGRHCWLHQGQIGIPWRRKKRSDISIIYCLQLKVENSSLNKAVELSLRRFINHKNKSQRPVCQACTVTQHWKALKKRIYISSASCLPLPIDILY